MGHGLFRNLIPDSSVTLRLEFASLMMIMPVFYMFIENLIRGKVTKPTWTFFFFCAQYNMEGAIFLPATGYRSNTDGSLGTSQGRYPSYWSSSQLTATRGYALSFENGGNGDQVADSKAKGFPIRPVKNAQ